MRRVVLCGPPIAGKTSILQAFAVARGLALGRFEPQSGSGEVRDRGVFVCDTTANVELMTVCGAVWNEDTWPVVIAGASALALVLDRQIARAQVDREFAESLARMANLPVIGCVIWTKEDLIVEGVEKSVPSGLLDGTLAEMWRSFATRYDQPNTVLDPLEWLLAQLNGARPDRG